MTNQSAFSRALKGPTAIEYGSSFVQQFKRSAKHLHVADGGHSECWGDGERVLRLVHRSRRNQVPRAYLYQPGSLNDYNEPFQYRDYFLPEDFRRSPRSTTLIAAAPRFWAQWIAKQFHDENGEWIPDNDEYQQRLCRDVETAKRVAIDEGKRCNVVEWARVCEENFNPEVNIPAWHSAAWDTVRVWHGDWQGNWDEESWS